MLNDLGAFFQVAYVTSNFDDGVAAARATLGVAGFFSFENATPLSATKRVALGYQGDTMIEVIEPRPGAMGIYADAFAQARPLAFHHHGYLVDPEILPELDKQLVGRGVNVPVRNVSPAGELNLIYADTRPSLGHYVEIVARTPAILSLFEKVPRG